MIQIGDKITGFVEPGGWSDESFFQGTVYERSDTAITARLQLGPLSASFSLNEEHVRWIRGWHDRTSREVVALSAAYALSEKAA